MNIREACEKWVNEFNAIPLSVVEKIDGYNEVHGEPITTEVTPPAIGDRVYITDDEEAGNEGEIVGTNYDGEEDLYEIRLDGETEGAHIISSDSFQVLREDFYPMWGTMWTFGDKIDEDWVLGLYCDPHLQEMANCGFRIYESEDLGVIFGIDGAGYDFYESHWIPLYKARGLKWHDEE